VKLARLASLLLAAALAAPLALAQGGYPNRPIRILMPFPPAQISDSVARAIGDGLREALGQPVVIENKPGPAGSIGVAEFAKAPPDGYTLLLGATAAFASNKFLYKNVPCDPLKDFQPITLIPTTRLLLMVGAHVPAKSMAELVKIMREQPEKHRQVALRDRGSERHREPRRHRHAPGRPRDRRRDRHVLRAAAPHREGAGDGRRHRRRNADRLQDIDGGISTPALAKALFGRGG